MKSFFLCLFLSSIMYGACAEESDDSARFVHAPVDETEHLLQTYFGPRYEVLTEGKVDDYWCLVKDDLQDALCSFEDGLNELKCGMEGSWCDPYTRMRWVDNVYTDLIEPVERLRSHDKVFTCQPCLQDMQLPEGEGQRFLEKYQLLREYFILSSVVTYVRIPCAPLSQYSVSTPRTTFISDHAPFFSSKIGFRRFCYFYCSSYLQEQNAGAFVTSYKVNLRRYLYHFDSLDRGSLGLQGKGVLRATWQVLMPERLLALCDNILLHGMPYMEQGFENFTSQDFWSYGSVATFGKSLSLNCTLKQSVALWKNLYPEERYPFAYIVDAMKEQMKKAYTNPLDLLKIMVAFNYMLDSQFCASIEIDTPQELLRSLQQHKIGVLTDLSKGILDVIYGQTLREENALEHVNSWYQQYFIEGFRAVIANHGQPVINLYGRVGDTQDHLFWVFFNAVMQSYGGYKSGVEGRLWSIYKKQRWADVHPGPEHAWLYCACFVLRQSADTAVRCRLGKEPLPLVQWNDALKVLVVHLPYKGFLLPKVMEMQGLQTEHPILSAVSSSDLIGFLENVVLPKDKPVV